MISINKHIKKNQKTFPFWTAIIAATLLFLSGASGVYSSDCLPLADKPMELATAGAPGLIMAVLDVSGSMDWTLMTPEADGIIILDVDLNGDGDYKDAGDYYYEFSHVFDFETDGDPLIGDYKMLWKSQWSGYNMVYYNPSVQYNPWPRYGSLGWAEDDVDSSDANADPDWPRRHPKNGNYFDGTLNKKIVDYQSMDENFYTRSLSPKTIIIDDLDTVGFSPDAPGAGFSKSATDGGYFSVYNAGYDNHCYWPNGYLYYDVDDHIDYNYTWDFTGILDTTYNYDVYAYWEGYPAYNSATVNYSIYGDSDYFYTVDQINDSNKATAVGTAEWYKMHVDLSVSSVAQPRVEINHTINTPRGSWGDEALGDAVMFMPTATEVNIIIAHYYVKGTDGNVYLVNLDSGIHYFKVLDEVSGIGNSDGIVDNGELEITTPAEAAAVGIVSGNTYAEERQNFANWFQFFRKRDFGSRNAMAMLVTVMGNIYFGFTQAPPTTDVGLRPVRVEIGGAYYDDTDIIIESIYDANDPLGGADTPLRVTAEKIGVLFKTGSTSDNAAKLRMTAESPDPTKGPLATAPPKGSYPFFAEEWGGACQQAFLILMSDGAIDNQAPTVAEKDADSDNSSIYDGGKYADAVLSENTLADIAMYYYETDLNTDLPDEVPINYMDENPQQHMVTYGVTYGTHGSILWEGTPEAEAAIAAAAAAGDPPPDVYNLEECQSLECQAANCCPPWPEPVGGELTTVDEVIHATVNGRGLFLNASNPTELVEALMKIKADIELRLGSAAAVTTSTVQRQIGTKLYQGLYNTGKWTGDLLARNIDFETGTITDIEWRAATQLENQDWDTDRVIITSDGSAGIPFRFNSMDNPAKTDLLTSLQGLPFAFGTVYEFGTPDLTDVANLVDYLRGDISNDRNNAGNFRARAGKLGDIVHSEPEAINDVVYIGANDGMLHAFDEETGNELFAYVPRFFYDRLGFLAYPQYDHRYYIDGNPYAKYIGSYGKTFLVCGLGKGAKGIFCLDVTNAATATEATAANIFKWEYVDAADGDLGYSFSQPYIVYTKAAGWVVIFGNGYSSTNEKAVLYVLDVDDGSLLAKLDTESGGVGFCNGLSDPAIIDPDFDGAIDYVFAGDLLGNLWKFDLSGNAVADWHVAFDDGTVPQPLITVSNAAGTVQSITSEPDVMRINNCKSFLKGYLVVFGTGRYLGMPDVTDTTQQSLYGIYDWSADWVNAGTTPDDKFLGLFKTDRTLSNVSAIASDTGLNIGSGTLIQRTVTFDGSGYGTLSDEAVDYFNILGNNGTDLGWYIDLPKSGERSVRNPLIRNQIAVFVTNIPASSVCSSGGSSNLFEINACGGNIPEPQFDTNDDGKIDENDDGSIEIKEFDEMLFDPIVLMNMLYLSTAGGEVEEQEVPDNPPGMSFWRIIE